MSVMWHWYHQFISTVGKLVYCIYTVVSRTLVSRCNKKYIYIFSFESMTSLKSVLIIRSWSTHIYTSVTFKFLSLGRKIVFAYNPSIITTLEILRDCKVSEWSFFSSFNFLSPRLTFDIIFLWITRWMPFL